MTIFGAIVVAGVVFGAIFGLGWRAYSRIETRSTPQMKYTPRGWLTK